MGNGGCRVTFCLGTTKGKQSDHQQASCLTRGWAPQHLGPWPTATLTYTPTLAQRAPKRERLKPLHESRCIGVASRRRPGYITLGVSGSRTAGRLCGYTAPAPGMCEKGGRGGGGLKGGGGWLGSPSSQGPPMVPAEGGPKIF